MPVSLTDDGLDQVGNFGDSGVIGGGYGYLPFLLQLLQSAVQSGQFKQTFGENQRQFNESLQNMIKQFQQGQTGYIGGDGGQPRGGYDEAVAWHKAFESATGRAPTREEWISGVGTTLGIPAKVASYIYDEGTRAGTVSSRGGVIPTREQFANLLQDATKRYSGAPSLQREQFESNLALQLANLDRTNPYASARARLGLSPDLARSSEELLNRLRGQSDLPLFGQSASPVTDVPPPGGVPNPSDRGLGNRQYWNEFTQQWEDTPHKSIVNNTPRIPDIPGITTGGPPPPARKQYPLIPDITSGNLPSPQAGIMSQPSPQAGVMSQPLQGQQFDYGKIRRLLPSELDVLRTTVQESGTPFEDFLTASRRALPSGVGRLRPMTGFGM